MSRFRLKISRDFKRNPWKPKQKNKLVYDWFVWWVDFTAVWFLIGFFWNSMISFKFSEFFILISRICSKFESCRFYGQRTRRTKRTRNFVRGLFHFVRKNNVLSAETACCPWREFFVRQVIFLAVKSNFCPWKILSVKSSKTKLCDLCHLFDL
jgi:hypothetical protein